MPSNDQNGYYGYKQPEDSSGEYNALLFTIRQALANCSHVALVKVTSVTSAGELAPAGRLDALPLVNQLDGQGNAMPHEPINNLVYLRMQGGANAVIMDPEVGDIGLAVFADRDISAVVETGVQANPGSARQFSMSDGIYLGGVLNAVPEQFVRFSPDGIEIVSPTAIRLAAPDVRIECERLVVKASNSVTITTPQFSVLGAASVSGLTSLNGGFAALPRSGGGASTISGNITQTGDFTNTGNLVNNGKNVGSPHTHTTTTTGNPTSAVN